MNGYCFEPSPELQVQIDEALDRRLRERQNAEWSSGRGVVIDPERLNQRVQVSSVTSHSHSSYAPVAASDLDSHLYAAVYDTAASSIAMRLLLT